jgi:hypothetical protein
LEELALANAGDTDIVYVVQAKNGGPVKIGHTSWRRRFNRLAAIQTGNPHKLVFRRLLSGDMWLEQALHRVLEASRLEGEWFALTEDVKALCPEAVVDV